MPVKKYLNFDLEILRSGEQYRSRVIDSPQGQGSANFEQPFSLRELADSLGLVGGELRHLMPHKVNGADKLAVYAPESFGARLYQLVFSGEVGEMLRSSMADAEAKGCGLRIRLRLNEAPELARMPWEYLYDTYHERFFGHSSDTPIVRYLAVRRAEEPLTVQLPLRILVMISDPIDVTPRLNVKGEWAKLQAVFRDLVGRDLVVLEPLEAATLGNLRQRLLQSDPVHILHFIGHGQFEAKNQLGGLLFEDDDAQGFFISAQRLAALLRDHQPRLIFLNACEGASAASADAFTGTAQHLVRQGSPAVIAMQFAVRDTTAVDLAQAFYQALAEGLPVDAALAEARKAIYTQGSMMEWGTPVLFMRSEDGCLFELKKIARTPPCPYPGMAPFTEQQAKQFFGRADAIQDAVNRLRIHPFLAVIGPSGSGKSSLVFAGLLPALRNTDYFGAGCVESMRPGEKPLTTLALQLKLPLTTSPEQALALPALAAGERLLLIIDQLEELFTLSTADEVATFQKVLLQLAALPNLFVIVTVRADFYANLMTSDLWGQIKDHRLEVRPLDREGLRQAILEPAQKVGVTLETDLVERLLADAAGEPGVLPLLQETLVLLWGNVKELGLSLQAYKALVGQQTARTALQVAIAYRADQAMATLPVEGEPLARRIFLRLVQFGEGRADTRRQQPAAALHADGDDSQRFEQTLGHLTKHNLLTLNADEQAMERKIDITHEALIEGWPRFQTWLGERREAEKTRRRLEAKASEWEALKGQGGWLDALQLREAEAWLAGADAVELGHSKTLLELVQASRRAERQKKAVRWFAAAAAVAALALLILASFFGLRTQTMDNERLETDARRQANLALQQLAVDPIVALNQSLDALPSSFDRKPYVPEAEFALTQALRTDLERKYQLVSTELLNRDQIALGQRWVAAGGTALHLVAYDLSQVITLTGHTSPVLEVQWDAAGKILFSRDAQSIRVWQDAEPVAAQPFDDDVTCMQVHPNQAEIAVCEGKTVRLWSYGEQTLTVVYAFTGTVKHVVWSPDGQWLAAWDDASTTASPTLLIWQRQTHQSVTIPYTEAIRYSGWSSDSQLFVTLVAPGLALQLWRANQPGDVQRVDLATRIDGIEFLDAAHFISWGTKDVTRLWSVDDQQIEPVQQYGIAADAVQGVALAPDRQQFLTFLSNGAAYLWDIETADRLANFCCHQKPMLAALWHADGYLATSGKDGTARLWEIASGQELITLAGHRARAKSDIANVFGLRWQGNQQLLSYGEDGTVRLWQVFDEQGLPICAGLNADGFSTCHDLSRAFTQRADEITFARWVSNDTFIITDRSGVDQRFSTIPPPLNSLNENTDVSAIWSPDGQRILTYTVGSTGYVLDFTTGVQLAPISGPITTAFWLQNDWLLVQGVDPARLVAPATGATLAALSGYTSLITAAQWHPNGRLATAEQNGIIHIWDTVNGEEVRRFRDDQPIPEAFSVHRLVWSPQGEYLLAASDKVTLWDAESGQVIWSSGSLGFEKAYTDLSPNGQLVAITAGANFFVLDSKTGTSLWSNQAHTQPLTGIAWIKGATWPDQERVNWLIGGLSRWINGQPWRPADARLLLLTWGGDGTVRLWDWQHQVEILRLADTGPILTTAVSPDGASILTVAGASVRIWDMWHQDPDRLRNLAHSRITR